MKKESRNMYKVDFARHLLLILEKLKKLDEIISVKTKNKQV